jgi:hypothetical protein
MKVIQAETFWGAAEQLQSALEEKQLAEEVQDRVPKVLDVTLTLVVNIAWRENINSCILENGIWNCRW